MHRMVQAWIPHAWNIKSMGCPGPGISHAWDVPGLVHSMSWNIPCMGCSRPGYHMTGTSHFEYHMHGTALEHPMHGMLQGRPMHVIFKMGCSSHVVSRPGTSHAWDVPGHGMYQAWNVPCMGYARPGTSHGFYVPGMRYPGLDHPMHGIFQAWNIPCMGCSRLGISHA